MHSAEGCCLATTMALTYSKQNYRKLVRKFFVNKGFTKSGAWSFLYFYASNHNNSYKVRENYYVHMCRTVSLVRLALILQLIYVGSASFYLLLMYLRYSSDWKLSLQNHSCNIPLESSWHQEVRNHHIFCVASNDATLWIATKLTRFTLFEL